MIVGQDNQEHFRSGLAWPEGEHTACTLANSTKRHSSTKGESRSRTLVNRLALSFQREESTLD